MIDGAVPARTELLGEQNSEPLLSSVPPGENVAGSEIDTEGTPSAHASAYRSMLAGMHPSFFDDGEGNF